MKPRAPTMIQVKPTGTLPLPLPRSMRKPGKMSIPVGGATVALTRFIQRRIDGGDLVQIDNASPAPAAKAANDAATPATSSAKGS